VGSTAVALAWFLSYAGLLGFAVTFCVGLLLGAVR
jgi:hypothetical protein